MRLACGCPQHFPHWHNEDVDLSSQPTHILPIPTLFHMPLAYETYLQKQFQEIEQLGLQEKWPGLVLCRTGFFRGQLIAPLEHDDSPSRRMHRLESPFLLRALLHDGDMSIIKSSIKKLQMDLFDMGRMPKELYLCYLTCPQCADERGGSKILLLRRWQKSDRLKQRLHKKK